MTSIQQAAEGAEWALERAARVVESNLGRSWIGTETPRDIATAIRSLSTTSIPISGSSGSDRENTIKEESNE